MKPYIGKYASGARKAAEQRKAHNDFIKSLPLAIRKAIKSRDAALIAYNTAVIDGLSRETVNDLGAQYRTLREQVEIMVASR